VTTCAEMVPIICNQAKKSSSRCLSIPTGVDPTRIVLEENSMKTFRSEMGISSEDFLVGTACFMRSWKGIDDLLKAADLLRDVPHIKWVIIGGGHAEKYIQKAKQMGLEKIVYFSGHLKNPFPALASLDLFTLLSTAHEGVSQAILQAAYLEKPLVATSIGGLKEVCLDRLTGIQVEPFSPDQVAKAVRELKGNKGLCLQMGTSAKKLVEDRFTMRSTIDQMEAVYKQVL
jgi:glycosyltransferase involved in cell wall biosynthesis